MKKFFFWIACLFILTLFAFMVTETFARLFFGYESYSVHSLSEFEHDSTLGWKGIPGFRGKTPLTNSDVEINQNGFRDGDWEEKLKQSRERGLPRFLFLGDSCTYGYEIPLSARLGEQLAHIYNQKGREVAIFNAGIPAWGTAEEFRALQKLLPIIDPQFVFLQYSTNDIGDSCLPYDWANPKFRVYRPYYDTEGNLVLNEIVPKRFSLRIRGTLFKDLRLKFLVDRLEAFLEDYHYSSLGVSANRRVSVDARIPDSVGFNRHIWDMGVVGYHPAFKDIYDQNKGRNFVLWKRMNELCQESKADFFVLTTFSGNTDPNHPEQEIVDFLERNDIKFINMGEYVGDYIRWGMVNYDGHPNFISNYLYAVNLYNKLENTSESPNFGESPWIKDLPRKIDFQVADYFSYVMGGYWDKHVDTHDGKRGRWLRGKAGFVLKGDERGNNLTISLSGTNVGNNPVDMTITIKNANSSAAETIHDGGVFCFRTRKLLVRPQPVLFVDAEPDRPVFIHSIEATYAE